MTTAIWIRSALLIAAIWFVSLAFLRIVYSAFDMACASAGKPCPGGWIEGVGLMVTFLQAAVVSLIAAQLAGRGATRLQLGLWYLVMAACALCASSVTWTWIPVAVGLPSGLLTLRWPLRGPAFDRSTND